MAINFGEIGKKVGEIVQIILGLTILGSFIYYGANEYFVKDKEEVTWAYDGMAVTILECRFPLGSLFNKDEITLRDNNIIIKKRSIFGDEKYTLPFNQIKKAILSDGLFWKSAKIEKKDFWDRNFTLYFKEENTKDLIKIFIFKNAPNIVVVEKRTFSLKLFDFYKVIEES